MTTGIQGDYSPNGRAGSEAASSVSAPSFGHVTGFGRGYETHEVDDYVQLTNTQVSDLNQQRVQLQARVQQLESENADLGGRVRGEDDIIQQSVSILTTAQQTADSTVKNADDYSGKVMQEARRMYDDAARQARGMVAEAERVARENAEKAAAHRLEVERQTIYLRTLLDASKVQLSAFLDGMLRHVGAEFGKAPVRAAEAAAQFPPWDQREQV